MSSFPNEWLCPITLSIMRNPVIASDGHSYEKSAIEEWFMRSNHSPKTNEILRSLDLIPNHALRNTIEDFFKNNPLALHSANAATVAAFTDTPLTLKVSTLEHASKKYVHASVTAVGEPKRQPVVIIAIVDNSGSMGEPAEPKDSGESYGYTRQDLVGHGLMTLASILGPEDMMAIIKFSTSAQIVMRPCKMDDVGKAQTKTAIKTIHPDSQTNIYDGCRLANEMANQPELAGRHIVGILLTDGFPNVDPPRGIIQTLKNLPSKNTWSLSTFGFGYNLDSTLLSQLAEWGHGVFGFIPDCTMVGTVLINYLANVLSTASRDAILTYNGVTVKTGPIQFGQSRDFIFNLVDSTTVSLNGVPTEASDATAGDDYFPLLQAEYCKAIQSALLNSNGSPIELFYQAFNTIATSENGKNLLRDIKSKVESEGQVAMALQTSFFAKWGAHYLRSYLHAQLHQMCMNFKDPGLQIYGGDLFHQIQTEGDVAFTTLPPPVPSDAPLKAAANAYGYYGGAIPLATTTPVSMASWHNQSGGCFNGDCKILMADGSRQTIKTVRAGDFVKTPSGDQKVYALVVCGSHLSSQPMVQLGNLSITPWHPIMVEDKWVFPASLAPYTSRPIKTVYNFVLAGGHIVDVEGYQCCTLGHGFKGPVIEHDFFGTEKVVSDLRKVRGWETGRPTFINLVAVRDLITGMITAWLDEPF